MKRIDMKWLMLLLCLPLLMTACDWEDLPAYEEAEISAVQFYYRWPSDAKDPVTGEPIVKEQRLNTTNNVNSEAGTVEVSVSVPGASGDLTESVRNEVSVSRLWGQATISTAARMSPINGSPAMGTPGDWSKENKYEVMAADGTKKIWTIKIIQFDK